MDKNWDEGLADDDPELLDEKVSELSWNVTRS